jgi:hypothetical protein
MSLAAMSCVRKIASANCVVEWITPRTPGGVAPCQPGPATIQEPAPWPVVRLPM